MPSHFQWVINQLCPVHHLYFSEFTLARSTRGDVSKWGTIMCLCNPKITKDAGQTMTPLGKICNTAHGKKYGYVFDNNYKKQSDISRCRQVLQKCHLTTCLTYTMAVVCSYVTYTDAHKSADKFLPCSFQYSTHKIMDLCLPALDTLSYELVSSFGVPGSA